MREKHEVCKAGLRVFPAPVQHLVVILPAEEQPAEVLESLQQEGAEAHGQQEHRHEVQEESPEEQHGEADRDLGEVPENDGPAVDTSPASSPSRPAARPQTEPDPPRSPLQVPPVPPAPVSQAAPVPEPPEAPVPVVPGVPGAPLEIPLQPLPQRVTRLRARATRTPALKVQLGQPASEIRDMTK